MITFVRYSLGVIDGEYLQGLYPEIKKINDMIREQLPTYFESFTT